MFGPGHMYSVDHEPPLMKAASSASRAAAHVTHGLLNLQD